jgi:peroxiredoxin
LRRWEELRPELDARGVKIVTVSTDKPGEIRKNRHKHGAQAIMLADPDLAVTTKYGLRNETNISPSGISALPVPTTFLVDRDGTVRWIDQSTDYQQRSAPGPVMAEISSL